MEASKTGSASVEKKGFSLNFNAHAPLITEMTTKTSIQTNLVGLHNTTPHFKVLCFLNAETSRTSSMRRN